VKHWKPEGEATAVAPPKRRGKRLTAPRELAHWATVDRYAPPAPEKRRAELPAAIVGLALVAAACVGVCVMLYQVSGPRDTFAEAEQAVE
jgi:hypothetical protein